MNTRAGLISMPRAGLILSLPTRPEKARPVAQPLERPALISSGSILGLRPSRWISTVRSYIASQLPPPTSLPRDHHVVWWFPRPPNPPSSSLFPSPWSLSRRFDGASVAKIPKLRRSAVHLPILIPGSDPSPSLFSYFNPISVPNFLPPSLDFVLRYFVLSDPWYYLLDRYICFFWWCMNSTQMKLIFSWNIEFFGSWKFSSWIAWERSRCDPKKCFWRVSCTI